MSWILHGYTVVFAAFLALAGRVADRFGHTRVFLTGLAVFTLASAACAAAPSVWLLVAAGAAQAVGAALVVPASLSLLLAAYPADRRTRAVGWPRSSWSRSRPASPECSWSTCSPKEVLDAEAGSGVRAGAASGTP